MTDELPDIIYITGRYVCFADEIIFMQSGRKDPRRAHDVCPAYIRKTIHDPEIAKLESERDEWKNKYLNILSSSHPPEKSA